MPVRHDPPPTHMLQAFSSVAKLKSFSRAAAGIGVSQSAISQRIAALEARLGTRLLRRENGQFELTAEGAAYLETVDAVLDALRRAASRVADRRAIVRISVLPSFARCWLAPRLAMFASSFPDMDVALHVSDDKVSLDDGDYDLAIRLRPSADRSGESMTKDDDVMIAVAAPGRSNATSHASDPFADLPLLADDCGRLGLPVWEAWRSWYRLNRCDRTPARGFTFNDAGLMVEAALSGAGAALVRRSLVADSIEAGKLVSVGSSFPSPGRTVLLERPRGRSTKAAQRVARWFLDASCKA